MLLSFRQLKGKQRIFRKLTGLSLEEFAEVITLVTKGDETNVCRLFGRLELI